jgi:ketosteroid isomerase-like protein
MTPARAIAPLLALLVLGCTIEPRADTRGAPSGPALPADTNPETLDASVESVVDALAEALRVGDGARVAALAADGVTLIDQEEGVVWTSASAAGPLPSALSMGAVAGGLSWTLVSREISPIGTGRLVVSRYRADVAGEPVDWWAVETLIIEPVEGQWRVRHLHRSRGPLKAAGAG